MPFKSRYTVDIPETDFSSYLLGSADGPLPETLAFVDVAQPLTHHISYDAYREWSKRLAAGLQAAGLRTGERVLLFAPNSIFFPVVFMGTIMAGGVFTGANPGYVARELAHQLGDADPKFLLVATASRETGLEAAKLVGMPRDRVFLFDDAVLFGRGDDAHGIRHWKHLLADAEAGKHFSWKRLTTREQVDRTIVLNYSSGTTGLPKGVEISHYNYVSNCHSIAHLGSFASPERRAMMANPRWLCFVPLYHAMGQATHLAAGVLARVPMYIMSKFSFRDMLAAIHHLHITDVHMVPSVIASLVKHPAVRSGMYDLSSLRKVASGAAPLGHELVVEMKKLWPPGAMVTVTGYGMTECVDFNAHAAPQP